jgi:predicted NAD/FAD-binding protein
VCAGTELPDVRTACAVTRVTPEKEDGSCRPVVHSGNGAKEEFDAVVLATHSDVSLALLGDQASEVASP